MLVTEDVFILDLGSEVFVWVGKGATADKRREGMGKGNAYCAQVRVTVCNGCACNGV